MRHLPIAAAIAALACIAVSPPASAQVAPDEVQRFTDALAKDWARYLHHMDMAEISRRIGDCAMRDQDLDTARSSLESVRRFQTLLGDRLPASHSSAMEEQDYRNRLDLIAVLKARKCPEGDPPPPPAPLTSLTSPSGQPPRTLGRVPRYEFLRFGGGLNISGGTPATLGLGSTGVASGNGLSVSGALGRDFGPFRVEGEVSFNRATANIFRTTRGGLIVTGPGSQVQFGGSAGYGSGEPGDSAPRGAITVPAGPQTETALPPGEFPVGSTTRSALSFMINGMMDFGNEEGLSGFVGGGVGVSRVRYRAAFTRPTGDLIVEGSDSRFAWQVVAGVRASVGRKVGVGLRYGFLKAGAGSPAGTQPDPQNPLPRAGFDSHSLTAFMMFML